MEITRQLLREAVKFYGEENANVELAAAEFNIHANRLIDAMLTNEDNRDVDYFHMEFGELLKNYSILISTQSTDHEQTVKNAEGKEVVQIINVQGNLLLETMNVINSLSENENGDDKPTEKGLLYSMLLGGDLSNVPYIDLNHKFAVFCYIFKDYDWNFRNYLQAQVN